MELRVIFHLPENGHAYIEAGRYNTFCGILQRALQGFLFEFHIKSQFRFLSPRANAKFTDLLLKVLFHNR
jgi:hypothetical protein